MKGEKKKEKVCFRCKKKIENGSHYFAFEEWNGENFVRVDYAHKSCWDEFLHKLSDLSEARRMMYGLKKSLQKWGILPEEEVIIK